MGQFVKVCGKRGLKVNAGKSKMMLMNGEEGLEYEIHVDGICLENISEIILDESVTDGVKCSRKVVSGKRMAGAIRSLVNARELQLECARLLHETLLVPVLT